MYNNSCWRICISVEKHSMIAEITFCILCFELSMEKYPLLTIEMAPHLLALLPSLFSRYLFLEQAVQEEYKEPLQTVEDGEDVGYDNAPIAELKDAKDPGGAQNAELGNGCDREYSVEREDQTLNTDLHDCCFCKGQSGLAPKLNLQKTFYMKQY